MLGKNNHKRAADQASNPGPTQHNQRKEAPWTFQLNYELNLCTADLTEDESEYDNSLDPAAHLIRKPPLTHHDSDTVPLFIVTGLEDKNV